MRFSLQNMPIYSIRLVKYCTLGGLTVTPLESSCLEPITREEIAL